MTSVAVDESSAPSTDIVLSHVVPSSPESFIAAQASLSDDQTSSVNVVTTDSVMSSADDSYYALNTTDNMSVEDHQEAPSDGSSPNNSSPQSSDWSETTASTSHQGELSAYVLQRSPASLHTALSSLKPRKQSRHEKKGE